MAIQASNTIVPTASDISQIRLRSMDSCKVQIEVAAWERAVTSGEDVAPSLSDDTDRAHAFASKEGLVDTIAATIDKWNNLAY
jgi:hypothetical protein